MLETMKKAVYAVGRFQPPTIGHAAMMDVVTSLAQSQGAEAFVFVSSTQGTGKEKLKNPLTSAEKVEFLQKMFPIGITFVDTARCDPRCGGPLAAYVYLVDKGYTDVTLVAGSDRATEFGPTGQMWKSLEDVNPPKFYAVSRDADDESESADPTQMSGTKARALAVSGNYPGFSQAVKRGNVTDADVKGLYDVLQQRLKPKKGGRKTRRIKQSRASGKALYRRGLRSRSGSSRTNRS
jgi:nicotinic acid mononucleotide adenylyltransferase